MTTKYEISLHNESSQKYIFAFTEKKIDDDHVTVSCVLSTKSFMYTSSLTTNDTDIGKRIINAITMKNKWKYELYFNPSTKSFIMRIGPNQHGFKVVHTFFFRMSDDTEKKNESYVLSKKLDDVLGVKHEDIVEHTDTKSTMTKTSSEYKIIHVQTCCGNPTDELAKQIMIHMKNGYTPLGGLQIMNLPKTMADHHHSGMFNDGRESENFLVQAVIRL